MLAEVAAVIAAVKGINDAISAVKTAGGHARLGKHHPEVRDRERKASRS